MKGIDISNVKIKNLEPMDFYNNRGYKMFGVGVGSSTLVPWYKDLLSDVLGSKIDEELQDYALSRIKTEQIKSIFEKKIDKTLDLIENPQDMPKHKRLEWKGKNYDLNLSLTSPNNRRLWDYYSIVNIAKECLSENKPMYLTLEH